MDAVVVAEPRPAHITLPPGLGQVVLVLQGGEALGAYQLGVYQALSEAGIEPDWVIGTSIGAINASLIAGNPPGHRVARLREFWARMEHGPLQRALGSMPLFGPAAATWATIAGGIPTFFRPNPFGLDRSHHVIVALTNSKPLLSWCPLQSGSGSLRLPEALVAAPPKRGGQACSPLR